MNVVVAVPKDNQEGDIDERVLGNSTRHAESTADVLADFSAS